MNKATIIMLAASLQPALGYAQNAGESLNLSTILGFIDTILGFIDTMAVVILAIVAVAGHQWVVRRGNKKDFEGVKKEFKKDFEGVKKEFKKDLGEVKDEFKEDFKKVDNTLGGIQKDITKLNRSLGKVEGALRVSKQGVSPESTMGAPQEHPQQSRRMQPPGEVQNPEERKRKGEGPTPSP